MAGLRSVMVVRFFCVFQSLSGIRLSRSCSLDVSAFFDIIRLHQLFLRFMFFRSTAHRSDILQAKARSATRRSSSTS